MISQNSEDFIKISPIREINLDLDQQFSSTVAATSYACEVIPELTKPNIIVVDMEIAPRKADNLNTPDANKIPFWLNRLKSTHKVLADHFNHVCIKYLSSHHLQNFHFSSLRKRHEISKLIADGQNDA